MYIFIVSSSIRLKLQIDPYSGCLFLTSLITCLLLLVFFGNSIGWSGEKTSMYSVYFLKTSDRAFSYCKPAIIGTRKRCVSITDFGAPKVVTLMIKVLEFPSCTTSTNSCLLISSNLLGMNKASAVVQDLQGSFLASNSQFALLRDKKSISNTTCILVSARRKIFSKNQTFSQLSWSKNPVVVILYIGKYIPSIFCTPTLVGL